MTSDQESASELGPGLKSQQFCSVCKEWLDMEVVPTSDGDDDDGVIWFRCPSCQGFLPKLSGGPVPTATAVVATDTAKAGRRGAGAPESVGVGAMSSAPITDSPFLPEDGGPEITGDAPADPVSGASADEAVSDEPIAEYAALLQAADASEPTPYRPWGEYAEGQCLHHLAWDDCGVVVGKETLPGGRRVIKCYFEKAGIVRLIEQEPQ